MNAALDVFYDERRAVAACVMFRQWTDIRPTGVVFWTGPIPFPYLSGSFYLRELPCLMAVLEKATRRFDGILIDGFVHLKPPLLRGLGAYLADAMSYHSEIIGVAKNPLVIADRYVPVLRGKSKKPLFVSAANCSLSHAAQRVAEMGGESRIPTLIRMAHRLAKRGADDDRLLRNPDIGTP